MRHLLRPDFRIVLVKMFPVSPHQRSRWHWCVNQFKKPNNTARMNNLLISI